MSQSAKTKAIVQLAALVLESASSTTHTNDLAERLELSAIAIYKWLNGNPISPRYALWIAYHLRDQVQAIANKRKRDQAQRLAEELFGNVSQRKLAKSSKPKTRGAPKIACEECGKVGSVRALFHTDAELAAHRVAVHGAEASELQS